MLCSFRHVIIVTIFSAVIIICFSSMPGAPEIFTTVRSKEEGRDTASTKNYSYDVNLSVDWPYPTGVYYGYY